MRDVQFVEGEGVNVYIRKSKADQEAEGLVKGLPYGSNKDTCPVTALRQWLQAAENEVDGAFEGGIFRRFYRGESIGEEAMTAQYVSTVLKRHAEAAGLDPEAYSAHFYHAGDSGREGRAAGKRALWTQELGNVQSVRRGGRDLSGQSRGRHWALKSLRL